MALLEEFRQDIILSFSILSVVIFVILLLFFRSLSLSLKSKKEIEDFIFSLSQGKNPEPLVACSVDFNEISFNLNQLRENLVKSTEFALTIGETKSDLKFEPQGEEDLLGNALMSTHQQLLEVANKDQQLSWVNEGVSHLIELTRANKNDFESYCDIALKHLIGHCGCNQGLIYSFTDQERMVVQACFAYDRKKYISMEFEKGDGLIGQMIFEKEPIHLSEIPEGYFQITSGLGNSAPSTIFLMPLMFNEHLVGAFELASFDKFGEKEINFFNQVAKHLASEFSAIQTNVLTQKLLTESQSQTENLKSQEEELRQNMEELQATHEELERIKSEEQMKTVDLLHQAEESSNLVSNILDEIPLGIFVKDKDLNMFMVNKYITDKHQCKKEDLIGLSDKDFFAHDPEMGEKLTAEEKGIISSGNKTILVHEDGVFAEVHHKTVIMETHKIPFYINSEKGIGILGFQIDRTESNNAEELIKELQGKFKAHNIKIED